MNRNLLGTNVDVNRKPLSLCPFVASFKIISLKHDFKHILNDFIYVYTTGQGQTTPWGQTFDVNRKPLSFCPFVAGLKTIALKSDFIYIFFMFHHMYIAPGRGRQFIGVNFFMTTERPFPCAHTLQVLK